MWPCSSQGLEKAFPQSLQTHGRVCVRMCIFRAPRLTYSLSQYLQLKNLWHCHSQWSCLCLARPEKVKYALWQSKHSKRSWPLGPGSPRNVVGLLGTTSPGTRSSGIECNRWKSAGVLNGSKVSCESMKGWTAAGTAGKVTHSCSGLCEAACTWGVCVGCDLDTGAWKTSICVKVFGVEAVRHGDVSQHRAECWGLDMLHGDSGRLTVTRTTKKNAPLRWSRQNSILHSILDILAGPQCVKMHSEVWNAVNRLGLVIGYGFAMYCRLPYFCYGKSALKTPNTKRSFASFKRHIHLLYSFSCNCGTWSVR